MRSARDERELSSLKAKLKYQKEKKKVLKKNLQSDIGKDIMVEESHFKKVRVDTGGGYYEFTNVEWLDSSNDP